MDDASTTSLVARLLSIQVGLPTDRGVEGAADPMDRPWTSGFFKESVNGPVRLGTLNFEGDGQADLVNHGGPDRPVLAYSADHYPGWREELGRPDLPFGAFGENLTIDGLDEDRVCIGDSFAIGPVVRLQVSQPRQPCWKLARRWRIKDLPARVVNTSRSGWYLRVLEEGTLVAGLEVSLLERPYPDWTVRRASAAMRHWRDRREEVLELASLPLLSASWRSDLSSLNW